MTYRGNRPSAHSRKQICEHCEIYWRSPISRISFWIRGDVAGINPCSAGANVYSLIRRDVRLFIKYQSPVRHQISIRWNSSAPKRHPARRDAIQSLCVGTTMSYNDFTRDIASLGELPILAVLYELCTVLLMEIYVLEKCSRN